MELNAKKKYRLIEIETPGDPTEVEEYESPYVAVGRAIGKLIFKVFQFGLYLTVTFLELLIKLLKAMFLRDFRPFNFILEAKETALDNRAKRNIDKYKIKFATEKLTRHVYEFERSEIYNSTYKEIQDKLKDFSDNNVAINHDIYKDILAKIDVLTVEVEKKALQEGYDYAAYTKYRLSDEEVYEDFIEYKIMRGEGHGKISKKQRQDTNWF